MTTERQLAVLYLGRTKLPTDIIRLICIFFIVVDHDELQFAVEQYFDNACLATIDYFDISSYPRETTCIELPLKIYFTYRRNKLKKIKVYNVKSIKSTY